VSNLLRKHIEEISPLTDEEFDYVYSHFTRKQLRKHQFLVQAGEAVTNNYFVLKGCLKAYHVDKDDKEHILQFAFSDWWVTDFYAFYHQTNATIYVDCIEDSELLSLSFTNREKLCAEMHSIERFFRKKTNLAYAALQHRIISLLNNNIRERYEKLLQLYPALFEQVPKHLIASYLGISRETLSRLRNDTKNVI
jgi:CRP-like cAMP-binding protein